MSDIVNLSEMPPFQHNVDYSNFLPYSDSDHPMSTVNTAQSDTYMELAVTSGTFGALETVLLNKRAIDRENGNISPNELSVDEKEQLRRYVQTFGHELASLAGILQFISAYDTYLYLIAFVEGRFRVVNEYTLINPDKKKKKAFIVLNGDMTVCGPLFLHGPTMEQRFIFALDDTAVHHYVEQYIDKLNRTDPRSFPVNDPLPNANVQDDPPTMETESLADQINILAFQEQILSIAPLTIDESTQSVEELFSTQWPEVYPSPIDDAPSASAAAAQEEISSASNTFQETATAAFRENLFRAGSNSIPSHTVVEGGQNSADQEQVDDSDLAMQADLAPVSTAIPSSVAVPPNTTGETQASPVSQSVPISYAEPKIQKQPKAHWKARYPRDLIVQPRMNTADAKGQFIGCLQAEGGQRSQIEVKVPAREQRQMYLATAVRTLGNQQHPLKIIVPVKTQVNRDRFNHENYLNYLEFHQCSPMDFFDLAAWVVYMKITPKEHEKELKKVPVYMFNLYQNQRMNKELIRQKQLKQCRLIFWFCVKQNNNYAPISPASLSEKITERKKKKQ